MQSVWDDIEYRTAIMHIIFFHIFLFLAMICFIRTIFSTGGELKEEYNEIYSIVNFIRVLFDYIVNHRKPDYVFSLMTRYKTIENMSEMIENMIGKVPFRLNVIGVDSNRRYQIKREKGISTKKREEIKKVITEFRSGYMGYWYENYI